MNVSLISLPRPYLVKPESQVPIGILYLASILEREGIHTDIHDLSTFSVDGAVEQIQEYSVYGITATSMEIPLANEFARKLKAKYPRTRIMIGGPGTISHEFVDRTVIDTIVVGEAEGAIVKIVKELPQYAYPAPIMTLDTIPFPARSKLSFQGGSIFANDRQYFDTASTTLLTSRGCPFHCAFCASPATKLRYRFRSPQNVIDEIDSVIAEYGIRHWRISDDMFLANPDFRELCRLTASRDIAWRISTRVKPFTKDIADTLVSGGCREVSFGVESFDQEVLNTLKKGTTAEENEKAIRIAHEAGLTVRILFMIRTPGQRPETVQINIDMLEKLANCYDTIACTSFIPIPGCDVWYRPEAYGITITNRDLNLYNFYFFGKAGVNELQDVFYINDRDNDEVNAESNRFRSYLLQKGKVNRG